MWFFYFEKLNAVVYGKIWQLICPWPKLHHCKSWFNALMVQRNHTYWKKEWLLFRAIVKTRSNEQKQWNKIKICPCDWNGFFDASFKPANERELTSFLRFFQQISVLSANNFFCNIFQWMEVISLACCYLGGTS